VIPSSIVTPSSAVNPRNEEYRFDKRNGVKNNPYNEMLRIKTLRNARLEWAATSYRQHDLEGEGMVGLKS